MKVKPSEWLALSHDEKMIVLEYAAFISKCRWERAGVQQ